MNCSHKYAITVICIFVACNAIRSSDIVVAGDVTHRFLACGQDTYIMDETGKKVWTYPHPTRDGFKLPNGNLILTLSKSKQHAGGAVVEVSPDGNETLVWNGTQSEVNSARPT